MRKREGSALMFTIMIMVVGITLVTALNVLIRSDLKRTSIFKETYMNTYIAESGLNAFKEYVENNTAEFTTAYSGSGENLDISIGFPEGQVCKINVSTAPTGDEYEHFMIIEIAANTKVIHYLMSDTSTGYNFIKYIDR